MARFHLANDLDSHRDAQQLCANAKLDLCESVENKPIFLSTYKKRVVDNQNFLDTDDGDFIATTGTFIIDGKVGKSALRAAYEVFERYGLEKVREAGFGQYSL
ncbi:hypothetical protein, partial [Haloparvum sedimenti]|uniref:hypothetical protein n=1 Tax=Haloparvum sedimenti TaxID=1678448 RepID=UPI001C4002E7